MPLGYDGLPSLYITEGSPLTPNLGLSLTAMDPIVAENFWLIDVFAGVPGISRWDQLQSAQANLTLNNAGFSTTFNQTSAVEWSWNNTTPATSTTPQNSPILEVSGTYWNWASSASAEDSWTFQDTLTAGGQNFFTQSSEDSNDVVIITAPGHTFIKGQFVTFSGLTNLPWLNGLTIALADVTFGTDNLHFIDPTGHGTVASAPETGFGVTYPISQLTIAQSGSNSGLNQVWVPGLLIGVQPTSLSAAAQDFLFVGATSQSTTKIFTNNPTEDGGALLLFNDVQNVQGHNISGLISNLMLTPTVNVALNDGQAFGMALGCFHEGNFNYSSMIGLQIQVGSDPTGDIGGSATISEMITLDLVPNYGPVSGGGVTTSTGIRFDDMNAASLGTIGTSYAIHINSQTSGGTSHWAIFEVDATCFNQLGTTTFLAVPTLPAQTANFVWAGPTTGVAAVPTFRALVAADIPSSTITPIWNNLQNATGALTLANGANATTFNQTSAVNWTWANTTAATSGTPQNSPSWILNGTYWTGSASAADGWTIQNVVGSGTNGTSSLSFTHSGTTGNQSVLITGTAATSGAGGLLAVNGGTTVGNLLFLTSNSVEIGYQCSSGNAYFGTITNSPFIIFVNNSNGNGIFPTSGGLNLSSVNNISPGLGNFAASGGLIILGAGNGSGTRDTGMSRVNPNIVGFGRGSAGDITGGIQLQSVNITDTVSTNTDLTIQNTTAATSGTSQSSPLATFNGTYWTGAASATDSWTIQDVVANGTNGNSTLTVLHAGSTGTKTFAIGTPGALTTSYNLTLCGSTLDSVMTQTGSFSHNVGSSAVWTLQGTNQIFAFEGQGNSATASSGIQLVPQAGLIVNHGLGFWSSQTGNTIDVAAQGVTDGNSIHIGGGNYVNLFTYVNSGQIYTGSLSLNQIGFGVLTNIAPTLATAGTAGSTTWGYQLVGIDANGQVASVSNQVQITTGNANLTGTNSIIITAPAQANGTSMTVAGIMRWDVYRVTVGSSPTSTGRIGQIARAVPNNNALTLRDTGLAGDGNAVPTVNVSGSLFAPGNIQISGSLTIKTPTQVQTQVETDNFTRANENPLSDGGNWTAMGGYVTGQIVSNLAQPTATNTNAVALWTGGGLSSPDQYSEITINTLVGVTDIVGPVVRGALGTATSNTTCYRGTVNGPLGATARLSIQKFVNGNQSDMTGLQTATINSGDKVRLSVVGTLLTLYINGVAVATTNDSTIGSGYPGIWMFAPTGGNTSDAALSAFFGGTNTQATELVMDNTGTLKTYHGETTAGVGTAYVRGSTTQKSETGADANVLTVTPASVAGTYRISIVMSVSAANTATLGWTATWTDSNSHAQAPTNLSLSTAGSATLATTVSAAANGTYYGEWYVDVDNSGTAIVIKTTFSGTSIAYKASAYIERIA